jgi:hypothetical protein
MTGFRPFFNHVPDQCPRRHAGAASHGNELFVLEGLAGSYLLNSGSQNDLGGGPRTTRRYSAADADQ